MTVLGNAHLRVRTCQQSLCLFVTITNSPHLADPQTTTVFDAVFIIHTDLFSNKREDIIVSMITMNHE